MHSVDRRIAVYLKHDAGLDRGIEAFLPDFDSIGPHGKVGDNVSSVRAAGDRTAGGGIGLSGFYFRPGNGRAADILHGSGNLRDGCRLRLGCKAEDRPKKSNN